MAEEEIVVEAPAAVTSSSSPVATDHKRKLQDLHREVEEEDPQEAQEPKAPEGANPSDHDKSDTEGKKSDGNDDEADVDAPEVKRLKRLDDSTTNNDGLASENGFGKEKPAEEEIGGGGDVEEKKEEEGEGDAAVKETVGKEEEEKEELDENVDGDKAVDGMKDDNDAEKKQQEQQDEESVRFSEEDHESDDTETTRKIEVPNDKVGVLIGKGGDTIRYLQYNSGAKIQITRDMDADPRSSTRPVELIGTLSSIHRAEKLINAVIAEADAGGSPSLVARGLPSAQTDGVGEQIEMQVPNEKVGLIIGRGGDTIKALQAKSGARIQLIPQHLPEGDGSKERTVRVTGDRKQIEIAKEMIEDVMSQNVRPSPLSGGYKQQQSYRPRGPTGPSHWGPRGPHSSQPSHYDYHHRGGPYPSQNMQYPPPSYGGYPPQHMGPRGGNFGSGWEQRPPNMQGPGSHGGGYDYYGGQGGHASDHPSSAPISNPISGHGRGPSPSPGMGHPSSQANYNYGQQHGPDYGHQAPYSQAVPQQGYGHVYDEPKYENHAQTQHPYGHGSSQPIYPQTNQPGYGAPQQQYGKQPSSYGMPSQGPPQSYGPPRPGQPGDMPYQAPIQSSQSYGSNIPSQQQYPYASSGPMQQSYPSYGATSATDGYNQGLPTSVPGYPQQGGQSVPSYGQPGGQQTAAYAQGPSGGYGSYPSSQQGYPEQPAQSTAGYGYQGSQDPAYASGPGTAYTAPASGQQGYAQPTATQPSYDQSVPQSGAYATAAASAPVNYGKTVSPQPGYPQYDSTQMYAAPR